MTDSVRTPTRFATRVLAWARLEGRHDLPWQRDRTPYRVWISEVMLQQTQVGTAIPYFERFMTRFPDIAALADSNVDEVLHLWSGLGYYSRARNVHKAARLVVERHEGRFPTNIDAVEALPGIGRSTAGAILSLSLDQSHPILDGNVKRVLCRHRALPGWPGASAVNNRLWTLATALLPDSDAGRYTQAMMDLGATVCTRRRPSCLLCPVSTDCKARAEGDPQRYPTPRPKRVRPIRRTEVAVIRDPGGLLLLTRRPPTGVWAGLFGFPELPENLTIETWCRDQLGVVPRQVTPLAVVSHGFTHFELQIVPWLAELKAPVHSVADADHLLWYNPATPANVGLAAPVSRLIGALSA